MVDGFFSMHIRECFFFEWRTLRSFARWLFYSRATMKRSDIENTAYTVYTLSADILDPAAPWPLRENAGGVIGATEIIVRVYVYAIAYSGASTIVCFLYSLPDTSIKR